MKRTLTGDKRQCAHEVLRRLAARSETQKNYARRADIDPATLTRLVHGMRPTEEVLRRLVGSWVLRADGIAVLCAHLRDEIARAGAHESEIAPIVPAREEDHTLTSMCRELRRYAAQDEQVADLLRDLVVVLRAADHAAARSAQLAADAPEKYRT